MNTKVIIQNLKCSGCVKTITKKLIDIENITNINSNIDENYISFDYKEDIDKDVVLQMLMENGYPVEGDANSIGTKAKSFVSCAIGKMS